MVNAMLQRAAAVLLAVVALSAPLAAQDPQPNPRLSADARADRLVAAMTEDEKLTLVVGYFGTDFSPDAHAPAQAREGSAGYVPGLPRLGVPPQWQTDAGLGVATQGRARHPRARAALPSGLATAATWNPMLAYRGGAMIGREAWASGFNVMLAGGVNLMRDPRNGRNFEYAGEDPLLAGTMVGSQIAGIQSNPIIATVKHYALNDQETGRKNSSANLDESAMRASDLLAFQWAIERGHPGAVMCAYNRVNHIYACENPWLLSHVLREDWGWPGYVMSDWGAVHSTASANAGLDQQSGYPFDDQPYFGAMLKAALAQGTVDKARLTLMARRIVRAMIAHGLIDHPVTKALLNLPAPMLAADARITRADAEEGMVLLKNANALLPLSPRVRRIVVIGGHADKGVLAGGGSSLVYPVGGNAAPGIAPTRWPGPVMFYPSSPLAEMRRLAPTADISFVDGSDITAAAAAAKGADVAIVFATQWAGEEIDVPLALPDDQDALIAAVAAANRNTVVVLETGGPVLTPWRGAIAGLIEAWYPGTAGGAAIARLIWGKANPSGRLPATFPASLDQLPRPAPPAPGDIDYAEGAAVGYKWYDAKGLEPAYPFGFGLSYTRFRLSQLAATPTGRGVRVRFTIRNTGPRGGKGLAQIYVAGAGWEAPKRLAGFAKLSLKAGEARRVTLTIDPRLLASWDTDHQQWRIAAGRYQVLLASSSRDRAARVPITLSSATLPAGWHS